MNKKHQEHIVCILSSHVSPFADSNGLVDYTLNINDLMIGQRAVLECNPLFRQVLPISVFTHKGKVWAYERTPSGGETRLHNQVTVAVGGHWDIADIVLDGSVINLEESIHEAMQRELSEEVSINATIVQSTELPSKICASVTEVDRLHLAVVYVHELDLPDITSKEADLKSLGFFTPNELLHGNHVLDTWGQIICKLL